MLEKFTVLFTAITSASAGRGERGGEGGRGGRGKSGTHPSAEQRGGVHAAKRQLESDRRSL